MTVLAKLTLAYSGLGQGMLEEWDTGVTWQWLPAEREGALMRTGPPE
jgi:hypothetical protein